MGNREREAQLKLHGIGEQLSKEEFYEGLIDLFARKHGVTPTEAEQHFQKFHEGMDRWYPDKTHAAFEFSLMQNPHYKDIVSMVNYFKQRYSHLASKSQQETR